MGCGALRLSPPAAPTDRPFLLPFSPSPRPRHHPPPTKQEDFGLPEDISAHNPIRGLSGGQKVKLVLAAAMWNNPHMLVLDEPTNYLDRESLGALASAITDFGGAVVMISHNSGGFVCGSSAGGRGRWAVGLWQRGAAAAGGRRWGAVSGGRRSAAVLVNTDTARQQIQRACV